MAVRTPWICLRRLLIPCRHNQYPSIPSHLPEGSSHLKHSWLQPPEYWLSNRLSRPAASSSHTADGSSRECRTLYLPLHGEPWYKHDGTWRKGRLSVRLAGWVNAATLPTPLNPTDDALFAAVTLLVVEFKSWIKEIYIYILRGEKRCIQSPNTLLYSLVVNNRI